MTARTAYNFTEIEARWRKKWQEEKIYQVDIQNAQRPFYNLWMFPYPSGARMHVGHAYASTGSDIIGRFKRMQGFDVLQPMGFDAFGIHGENYAIKVGEHPAKLMEELSNRFRDEQFLRIGHGYDWSKEVRTYWPSYYKWTQWIFLQLFKNGLAERKIAKVNWCPSCKTVLADEQVIAGECERCGTEVKKKELKQWFFKITKYADRLLKNLDKINWSKKVVEAQRNWIGRREGVVIDYPIEGLSDVVVSCFTTRPDTNFGATFVVLAPEHEIVERLLSKELNVGSPDSQLLSRVASYVNEATAKSEVERMAEGKKKTGVFTGLYALNRLTNTRMPIWISDFVLPDYGTGAVVGVPGHDRRDFEFAQEFDLPVIRVVLGPDQADEPIVDVTQVYEGEGTVINSGFLNGLTTVEARSKIGQYLTEKGWGRREVTYKLRDWLISRQRYWSAPIPIVYCERCGVVPVPEEQLPVELPHVEDWQPRGDGRGPLASIPEFVNTTCPKCNGVAQRETDTLDNFLDSGWYFFRYPFVNRDDVPFAGPGITGADDREPNSEAFRRWFPVHLYVGGPEHSVLHLMYTRFLTMAFHDLGFIDLDEPFERFFAHGHITKDGKKMSKSLGNIVNPDEYIDLVGADAFRIYLMFLGPFDQGGDFNDSGLSGVVKFLNRFWDLVGRSESETTSTPAVKRKLHRTIAKVTEDLDRLKFNTTVAALMELVNEWEDGQLSREDAQLAVTLIAPFAPFIAEELWQKLVGASDGTFESVHAQPWPWFDPALIEMDEMTIPVQVDGKLRGTVLVSANLASRRAEVEKLARASVDHYLEGKRITKVVIIPGKLLNFVTQSARARSGK